MPRCALCPTLQSRDNKLRNHRFNGGSPIQRTYLKRERLFVGTFIVLISIVLTRLTHNALLVLCGGRCPAGPVPVFSDKAPEAYRVGIPILASFLIRLFHLHDAAFALFLIEFPCCIAALILLYFLTVEDLSPSKTRIATVTAFFAFIQFPFAFVLFRQRPETLPTAFFIALSLFCVSRRGHRWTAILLVATFIQAFLRPDFPAVIGLALVLLSARNIRSNANNFLRGLSMGFIAGCVQAYLQFVRFPHLPYSTTLFMYSANLRLDHLLVLLLALSPFLFTFFLLRSTSMQLREIDRLTLLASLLYLPIWFTIGLFTEIRIYVPFLLALCVLAARISVRYLAAALPQTSALET